MCLSRFVWYTQPAILVDFIYILVVIVYVGYLQCTKTLFRVDANDRSPHIFRPKPYSGLHVICRHVVFPIAHVCLFNNGFVRFPRRRKPFRTSYGFLMRAKVILIYTYNLYIYIYYISVDIRGGSKRGRIIHFGDRFSTIYE